MTGVGVPQGEDLPGAWPGVLAPPGRGVLRPAGQTRPEVSQGHSVQLHSMY